MRRGADEKLVSLCYSYQTLERYLRVAFKALTSTNLESKLGVLA